MRSHRPPGSVDRCGIGFVRPCHIALELTHVPIAVSVEWLSKTVTTDPPKLTPHEEWRLSITLVAQVAIRAAVMLYIGGEVSWGLWHEEPS